jgi:hypothetical protein
VLLSSDDQYKIQDNLSWSIELSSCIARIGRLDELLRPTVYGGSQKESLNQDKVHQQDRLKESFSCLNGDVCITIGAL